MIECIVDSIIDYCPKCGGHLRVFGSQVSHAMTTKKGYTHMCGTRIRFVPPTLLKSSLEKAEKER